MWWMIVIVLILYLYFAQLHWNNKKYIDGVWCAHPQFCSDAEIADMLIYFDTKTNSCWIYNTDGENILVNHISKCQIKNIIKPGQHYYFKIFLEDPIYDVPFPQSFDIAISPTNAHMTLHNNDVMYFSGYKNGLMSDAISTI